MLIRFTFVILTVLTCPVWAQQLPALSPLLPPVTAPVDEYIQKNIAPAMTTVFHWVWASEQQCRVCVTANPGKSGELVCAGAFARLAATYALMKDPRADIWYKRTLSLDLDPVCSLSVSHNPGT